MRKLLLLLFVTIASQMLQAQNYNPFIFGKTYRYFYLNTDNSEFNEVYSSKINDSIAFVQKIDSVFINQNGDSVFTSVKNKYLTQTNGLATNIEFDYYIKKNSILTFYNSQNPYPYGDIVYKINTKSKIGDTLYLGRNSYSKHIKNDYITFLGIGDSVKVFEITTKIRSKDSLLGEIKLSKNYGFVNVVKPKNIMWDNESFYFANIFSVKDLNLGFRSPQPYRSSLGDTVVWGSKKTCPPLSYEKDVLKLCTKLQSDDYNIDKFSFEIIKDNKYIGVSTSNYIDAAGYVAYNEGIGEYESYWYTEGWGCTYGILYYKGAQGEFGDRQKLINILTPIDNSEIAKYLNIYPNPSNKTIYVNSLNNSLVTIDIYDLQGSKIKSIQSEQQLTSFDLNSGLYLLKLNVDNKVFTQKVIIK